MFSQTPVRPSRQTTPASVSGALELKIQQQKRAGRAAGRRSLLEPGHVLPRAVASCPAGAGEPLACSHKPLHKVSRGGSDLAESG